ncbi:MAG: DUF3095 domain-containing protein, partial [Cyanobacteria bacterium P01_A01_bin.105]
MNTQQLPSSSLRARLNQRFEQSQFCTVSTDFFYASLPTLTTFEDLVDVGNYTDAPSDWYILITDIAGSTQAIEQGHYKAVNFLGASSIVAVLNAVKGLEIPYVFGGDGATMLVPPAMLAAARDALLGLKQQSEAEFGLTLRVGVVPVPVATKKHPVKVAKFQVSEHYIQANFLGGGLTYATDLIKDDHPDNPYQIHSAAGGSTDLAGLECRWQDIHSNPHQTLSLLITPATGQDELVYRDFIGFIKRLYGKQNLSPIHPHQLNLSLNPQKLSLETRLRARSHRLWHRLSYLANITLQNVLGWFLMKFRVAAAGVDWGRYKDDIATTTDYRKVDDVLRMVIVSEDWQTQALTQYLQEKFEQRQLVYGLHVSDRALMTCLVFERHGQQVHFIDGA